MHTDTLFKGHQQCPQGSNKQIIIIIIKKKKNWKSFKELGNGVIWKMGVLLWGVGIFQFQWH